MRSFICFVTLLALALAVSASPIERRDDFPSSGQCTPGQAFFMSCNLCMCIDGKYAACTFMQCLNLDFEEEQRSKRSTEEKITELRSDIPRISGYTQGDKCPAKSFYNDCNMCICGPDDASAACTLRLCLPDETRQLPEIVPAKLTDIARIDEYTQGQACPAGEFFHDKCNVCHCSANGFSATCTLMGCPSEDVTQPRLAEINDWPHIDNYMHGEPCPADKMFYNQCNTCRCSPDGYSAACTMMLCLPEN